MRFCFAEENASRRFLAASFPKTIGFPHTPSDRGGDFGGRAISDTLFTDSFGSSSIGRLGEYLNSNKLNYDQRN
jgi:hypothetical protein